MADLFEETTKICDKPKKVSNWLMGETMRLLKENSMEAEEICFAPEHLAALIELVDAGTINGSVAKEVFEEMFRSDIDPEKYVEEKGLKVVNDEMAHCARPLKKLLQTIRSLWKITIMVKRKPWDFWLARR